MSINKALFINDNFDFSKYKVFGFNNEKKDYTYVREWYQPNSLIYSDANLDSSVETQTFQN